MTSPFDYLTPLWDFIKGDALWTSPFGQTSKGMQITKGGGAI